MPDKYVRVTFDVEIKMSEKKARKFEKARTVVQRGEKWLDHNHKMRTTDPEKYRKQNTITICSCGNLQPSFQIDCTMGMMNGK